MLGSIDTFLISYVITGKLVFAASIASVETFTKIVLFYFHERAWAAVPGAASDKVMEQETAAEQPARAASPTAVAAPVTCA